MKVLVADALDSAAVEALRAAHEVDVREVDAAQLLEVVEEYDALVVRGRTKVTAVVLERAARLKVIGRAGVGVDNIDVDEATRRKVVVVNAPASTTVSVAELTLGHMISLARSLPEADRSVRDGKWEKKRFRGTELSGKTLGLLGSGRIGMEVAARARAFGMRVVAFDPYVPAAVARERGVELVDLPTLLATSDFLSIHTALTDETRGMIGAGELGKMKRTAYLVNCARGEIVREADLAEALKAGTIAGAAVDVYGREPPEGSPLLSAPRVHFTPHLGASTEEAQTRSATIITEQVAKALAGERPEFVVNPAVYD